MQRQEKTLKTFISFKRVNAFLEQHVKQDVMTYGLNVSEFAILECLFHKGQQTVQMIVDTILIANSSTTYAIDKLCQKELVMRQQDTTDKRITYVHLTGKGHQLMTKSFPTHAAMLVEQFNVLSTEELQTFHQLLQKLSRYETE